MNKYLEEWTLNKESFNDKLKVVSDNFAINATDVKFYSQQDEDKYIIQYFLHQKINDGVFLEVGACDGVLYNNTKTLEDYFGFSGILIEPQKNFFEKLAKNRKNCECYNYAVSSKEEKFVKFYGIGPEGGITSTLNTPTTKNGINYYLNLRNLKRFFFNKTTFKVRTVKMSKILIESKFKYIDFMIIDVEGGELELLKSIDFSFPIFCIIVESHINLQEQNSLVRDFLIAKGYTFKERQRGNEVWLNLNYYRKYLFGY